MSKRRTPLQTVMKSVEVKSLSNGLMMVHPVWEGRPGVITRMYAALYLQGLINLHLNVRPVITLTERKRGRGR